MLFINLLFIYQGFGIYKLASLKSFCIYFHAICSVCLFWILFNKR